MKTAIAYVADNLICPVKGVIAKELQKERIERFARENGIEIIQWIEDKMCSEAPLGRSGVYEILSYIGDCDFVLVERVACFSMRWSELKRLYWELDRMGLKLQAASIRWDLISQMTRSHFNPELRLSPLTKRLRASREEKTVGMRRSAEFPGIYSS